MHCAFDAQAILAHGLDTDETVVVDLVAVEIEVTPTPEVVPVDWMASGVVFATAGVAVIDAPEDALVLELLDGCILIVDVQV